MIRETHLLPRGAPGTLRRAPSLVDGRVMVIEADHRCPEKCFPELPSAHRLAGAVRTASSLIKSVRVPWRVT